MGHQHASQVVETLHGLCASVIAVGPGGGGGGGEAGAGFQPNWGERGTHTCIVAVAVVSSLLMAAVPACLCQPVSAPACPVSCTSQDSNYFTLAIAPILRSMPQQKLRVLAELQVCDTGH
jgi:hypothetical protein